MAKVKKPRLQLTTPIGRFAWPWLNKPSTNFQSSVFKVDLVFEPDNQEYLKLVDRVEQFAEECRRVLGYTADTPLHLPFRDHVDQDKKPTGEMVFTCKLPETSKVGDGPPVKNRVMVVGPDGAPLSPVPLIGAGTTGRVAVNVSSWYGKPNGFEEETLFISFYIKAVQIQTLVEFGQDTPESLGLGSLEVDDISEDQPQPKF
jgi:hypothetical protein